MFGRHFKTDWLAFPHRNFNQFMWYRRQEPINGIELCQAFTERKRRIVEGGHIPSRIHTLILQRQMDVLQLAVEVICGELQLQVVHTDNALTSLEQFVHWHPEKS